MNGTLVSIIILIIIILFVISGVLWNILPGSNRTQLIIPDSIPSREDGIQFVGHSTLLIQMQRYACSTYF